MTTAANAAATTTTITSTTTTNALTTGLCPKRWELIACTSMTILCGMLRNLMRESGKMSLSPPSLKESKKPERIRFATFPASQDMFENVAHRKKAVPYPKCEWHAGYGLCGVKFMSCFKTCTRTYKTTSSNWCCIAVSPTLLGETLLHLLAHRLLLTICYPTYTWPPSVYHLN